MITEDWEGGEYFVCGTCVFGALALCACVYYSTIGHHKTMDKLGYEIAFMFCETRGGLSAKPPTADITYCVDGSHIHTN